MISLKPAYLETLTTGEHTLTVQFDDAEAIAVLFTITEEEVVTPEPEVVTPEPEVVTPEPVVKTSKTGDANNLGTWGILLAASLLGLVSIRYYWKKDSR
ncbi:MAG: hypothetical protein IJQ02_07745 [Oscillospiraceae bacterium]|nr:hypothetical protein [Bacillota bacterium]MBR0161155.1 hypothetical protein [Oscillospiraceae bacterium]